MSIFNTGGPLMAGGGGKIATWTETSGSSATTTTITFNVTAEPTEWMLVCVGAPSGAYYATAGYYIVGASYADDAIYGTYLRSGSRLYSARNIVTAYYNTNNTFTLTCESSYVFMRYAGSSGYVTYYLLYNTD